MMPSLGKEAWGRVCCFIGMSWSYGLKCRVFAFEFEIWGKIWFVMGFSREHEDRNLLEKGDGDGCAV
jgi:hypothetical protein